jgi:sigma-E factor negative regulatory protein RseA
MKQRVSELMDSELDESAAAHVIAAIEADASLKQDWNDYHLIGDALRANSRADVDVRAAVTAQLANEPVVLAPRRWTGRARVRTAGAVALAASVSFAAVIGWQQLYAPERPAMLLASADTAQTSQLQLASNNADAYFLAHQEMAADQGLVKVAYRQEAANQ